jgi:hypothetical protein
MADGFVTTLENMGCTEVQELEAVPDFIQGSLIAIALLPDSGEMIMSPRGQRVGKISEDVVELSSNLYSIQDVCMARDSKGLALSAINCSEVVMLIYDAPRKMKADYGCRFVIQVMNFTANKNYKLIVR